jgi:hypothetical protein
LGHQIGGQTEKNTTKIIVPWSPSELTERWCFQCRSFQDKADFYSGCNRCKKCDHAYRIVKKRNKKEREGMQ